MRTNGYCVTCHIQFRRLPAPAEHIALLVPWTHLPWLCRVPRPFSRLPPIYSQTQSGSGGKKLPRIRLGLLTITVLASPWINYYCLQSWIGCWVWIGLNRPKSWVQLGQVLLGIHWCFFSGKYDLLSYSTQQSPMFLKQTKFGLTRMVEFFICAVLLRGHKYLYIVTQVRWVPDVESAGCKTYCAGGAASCPLNNCVLIQAIWMKKGIDTNMFTLPVFSVAIYLAATCFMARLVAFIHRQVWM